MSDKIWGVIGLIFITIFIVLIFVGISNTPICNGSYKDETNICSKCNREFTNSEDTHSIAMTGMCVPCYENFKTTQKIREELKKYEERNR